MMLAGRILTVGFDWTAFCTPTCESDASLYCFEQ
jgi:hypothetical protein